MSHTASSDGESSETDTGTNSLDTAGTEDDLLDDDVMSQMTPFVDWDGLADLEMSSKSDDCLDEAFPFESLGEIFARVWIFAAPMATEFGCCLHRFAGTIDGATSTPSVDFL